MKMNNHCASRSFTALYSILTSKFIDQGHDVHTGKWQGADISNRPEASMRELLNVTFTMDLLGIEDLDRWRRDIEPNLPWADDHFQERVGGEPLNPGEQWKHWPWSNKANEFRDEDGQFNHTYMERLWPVYAGQTDHGELGGVDLDRLLPRRGIRFRYGDLRDLLGLMQFDPLTRQAWIPLFFPEDTGVGDGGRKPCTLGYQFMVRDDQLHIYYPLRSCDFVRHFRDDIYLAVRLGLWILEELRVREEQLRLGHQYWANIKLGSLSMHCTSLHMFRNDYIQLEKGLKK